MKTRNFVMLCLLLAVSTGITWSVARAAGDEDNRGKNETYVPTVEEWLQVWTNANFGRNDSRRTIQFIVPPGEKKVLMLSLITVSEEVHRADPGLRQKLSMEADMFETQVKGYAKRFGFDVKRQGVPNE